MSDESLSSMTTRLTWRYEDLIGEIDGDTWGWGVALPFGGLAGAAYDDAHFPQAMNSGLEPVHRQMVSAWIDVFAIWRATRA